ncbi:universal stress protein [Schlesneria paludicola]|uniref:universal stress protein n=1 Tax=Schlesneria paludicola TaxID=360056 RepID=UPI000299F56E|nr:universal stress protein [Schlesneria paludicola]
MMIGIRRILLPTDFSEPSLQAAKYAMALAHQFDAELHLLHVVSQVMPYTDDSSSWVLPANETQEQLEAAEQRLLKSVIDLEWTATHRVVHKTVVGFTVDEILAYAKENQIDLIVVGTHGYTWLAHTLIGSVAEKLVRAAHCPVLTIHPQDRPLPEIAKRATHADMKV